MFGHGSFSEFAFATIALANLPSEEPVSGGNWKPYRKKIFVLKLPKKVKRAIEDVAKLDISDESAEIALRLRLRDIEWNHAYYELQNALREAYELNLANTLHELKRFNEEMLEDARRKQLLAIENRNRAELIMMLS